MLKMTDSCQCVQHVEKLKQQINVMRKEMKNLRQKVDGALRAHNKHMASLQTVLNSDPGSGGHPSLGSVQKADIPAGLSLEQGRIHTVPIGCISSCFSAKNGTPRQPTVCSLSRATLRLDRGVFNNPQHALEGLQHYSHVWIIFLFHKNGHLSYKAKVKPPRLNGQRTGLYSTRSPHRPNALGLTLARLDRLTGDTLHLSGVDMIAGTPVLDIKPYIPDYDCPQRDRAGEASEAAVVSLVDEIDVGDEVDEDEEEQRPPMLSVTASPQNQRASLLQDVQKYISQREDFTQKAVCSPSLQAQLGKGQTHPEPSFGEESYSTIASWIRQLPASSLEVRFTAHAEMELKQFLPPGQSASGRPTFRFLHGPDEAAVAIRAVLSADPRSAYRRKHCLDRLFYFTLDTAHITCWFGIGFAEVLSVQPSKPCWRRSD